MKMSNRNDGQAVWSTWSKKTSDNGPKIKEGGMRKIKCLMHPLGQFWCYAYAGLTQWSPGPSQRLLCTNAADRERDELECFSRK